MPTNFVPFVRVFLVGGGGWFSLCLIPVFYWTYYTHFSVCIFSIYQLLKCIDYHCLSAFKL